MVQWVSCRQQKRWHIIGAWCLFVALLFTIIFRLPWFSLCYGLYVCICLECWCIIAKYVNKQAGLCMGFTTEDSFFVLNGDRKPSTEVECWTRKIFSCCCRSFHCVVFTNLEVTGCVSLLFCFDANCKFSHSYPSRFLLCCCLCFDMLTSDHVCLARLWQCIDFPVWSLHL